MRSWVLTIGLLIAAVAMSDATAWAQARGTGESVFGRGSVEVVIGPARQAGGRVVGGFPRGGTAPAGVGGVSFFRGHEPLAPHPAWQVHRDRRPGPVFAVPVHSRPVLPHQQGSFFEDRVRGRFHTGRSRAAPIRIRSYGYTVAPGYSVDPYGPYGVDPYGGVVHRGEGPGARVYRPDRDDPGKPGESRAVEDGRPGTAFPRVASVLEGNAVGQPGRWTDPRTGAETTVTPIRDLDGVGRCREFRHVVALQGGELEARGVACRAADGTWEILP